MAIVVSRMRLDSGGLPYPSFDAPRSIPTIRTRVASSHPARAARMILPHPDEHEWICPHTISRADTLKKPRRPRSIPPKWQRIIGPKMGPSKKKRSIVLARKGGRYVESPLHPGSNFLGPVPGNPTFLFIYNNTLAVFFI